VDDVEALELAPLPEMPPQRVLQRLGRLVLVLQQVAHKQRAAGLHEGANPGHVFLVFAVPRASEAVRHLLGVAVVLRSGDAVHVRALVALAAHAVREMHAETPAALLLRVALVGLGVACIGLQHAAVRGGLAIRLVVEVSGESPVPQVILVGTFCVVLLGIHKILLFSRRSCEKFEVLGSVCLRCVGSCLSAPKPPYMIREKQIKMQ
jgi:hypothetical protein